LKELEEKILGAEERIAAIEERLYADLLADLSRSADRVGKTASALAALDLGEWDLGVDHRQHAARHRGPACDLRCSPPKGQAGW